MRKKILMIGMTLLMAVAAIGCNGNQQNDNLKIQEQLDLGYKYLNELDYENAIATYMAILEVDAKCVSAYQGIAEVYMATGDYDNALKYAQEGFGNTGDESLTDMIKQIETLMAEVEAARLAEEEVAKRKGLFEGHFVDGIWHNEYREYDLTEEETGYLQQVIDNANAGNYDKVFDLLKTDAQWNLLVRLEKTYSDGNGGMVYLAYNEYKILAITTGKGTCNGIYVIPLTESKGYYLALDVNESAKSIWKYCYACDCKDGMYNGKLTGKESWEITNVSGETNIGERSIKGEMVNGLKHGVWLYDESRNFNGKHFEDLSIAEYTNGKPKAYKVEKDKDGKNFYRVKVERDENGNPMPDHGGSGPNSCTPEEFERIRCGIENRYSFMSERGNEGYWCYQY